MVLLSPGVTVLPSVVSDRVRIKAHLAHGTKLSGEKTNQHQEPWGKKIPRKTVKQTQNLITTTEGETLSHTFNWHSPLIHVILN